MYFECFVLPNIYFELGKHTIKFARLVSTVQLQISVKVGGKLLTIPAFLKVLVFLFTHLQCVKVEPLILLKLQV